MAVTLGTNCGFVSSAPVADPEGDVPIDTDGRAHALAHTSPATAVKVTEIGWYKGFGTVEGTNWECGIYDDDTAEPGDLLAGSDTSNTLGAALGWQTCTGLNITISSSTAYYVAFQLEASALVRCDYSGSAEGSTFYDVQASLPATWDTAGDTTSTRNVCVYAVWEAAAGGNAGIMTTNTGFWGATY